MPDIDLDDLAGPTDDRGFGTRLVALLALVVLAATAVVSYRLIVILLEGRRAESEARRHLVNVAASEARSGSTAGSAVDGGDDLKVIEGIGPHFESVLKAAGIRTFGELADLAPARVETILRDAGGRMTDPTTWPAQSRLAAEGLWQELTEMQSMLKGGRQVH